MQKENHHIYISKFQEFTVNPIEEANKIKKIFKWDFSTSDVSGYKLSSMSEKSKNDLRICERKLDIRLSGLQKQKIRRIYRNFPKVDFSMIDEKC